MSEGRTLRCFEYVNQPYEVVREAIAANPAGLFDEATSAATSRATGIVSDLRVELGPVEVAAKIDLEIGTPVHDAPAGSMMHQRTRLPLRWKAKHASSLFPRMIADLHVYPLSPEETQLDLRCTYQPPGGALGNAADAVLGHRVAEASIHRFLREVADRLEQRLAATG